MSLTTTMQRTGWCAMLTVMMGVIGCNQQASPGGAESTGPAPKAAATPDQPTEKPATNPIDAPAAASTDAVAKGDGLTRAVFAGGCFWCVEAVFEQLDGVKDAISGYAGGTKETAFYEAVSTGQTAHAEAVQIVYDPAKVSYRKLLEVHFATHDPTTLNRQGADVGPHYRSTIFYADEAEKAAAQAYIKELDASGQLGRPIVTTLEPLTEFYPAEAYHQDYADRNPNQGYIRGVALPKVDKVRQKFADDLKKDDAKAE